MNAEIMIITSIDCRIDKLRLNFFRSKSLIFYITLKAENHFHCKCQYNVFRFMTLQDSLISHESLVRKSVKFMPIIFLSPCPETGLSQSTKCHDICCRTKRPYQEQKEEEEEEGGGKRRVREEKSCDFFGYITVKLICCIASRGIQYLIK